MAYAERAPRLSEERAQELAEIAEPLLGGRQDARARVLGIAAWLLGRGGEARPS